MNIWLVYPYGAIPGEGRRPDRASMIAEALSDEGHKITWWASAFDHSNKKFRTKELSDIHISSNFTIRLVPTTGYKKNISFKRIFHENKYSKNILSLSKNYEPPDAIILSEPALFRGRPILKLVKKHKSLLVLDILDIWPELFKIALPKKLQFLGDLIFKPWYVRRKNLFKRANAVLAVSNSYIELAKKINPNMHDELTETVYFGTNVAAQREDMFIPSQMPASLDSEKKISGEVWCIYASTLGSNYDVQTLLETAKLIEEKNINMKLLIAGEGPLRKEIESFIELNKLKRTIYIGNPDSKTLAYIFSFCDIGLSMYLKGSPVTFPIKAFHYFAAGLPVVNSLNGDLSKILLANKAGMQYQAENCQSLFEVLNYLASNPDSRREMANNSYNLAMNFDQSGQYKKFGEILNKLLVGI